MRAPTRFNPIDFYRKAGKPLSVKAREIKHRPVATAQLSPVGHAFDKLSGPIADYITGEREKERAAAARAEMKDVLSAYYDRGGQPAYDAVANAPMDMDETSDDVDRDADIAFNKPGGIGAVNAMDPSVSPEAQDMRMALMGDAYRQRQAEAVRDENRRYQERLAEAELRQAKELKGSPGWKAPGATFSEVKDKNGRVIGQKNNVTGEIKAMPNADSGRYRVATEVDNNGNRYQVLIDTRAPGGPTIVQTTDRKTPAVPPDAVKPETPPALNRPPTKGENALDTEFAKEYAAWKVSGGRGDVEKNMGQLRSAITNLKDKKQNLTGATVGGVIPMSFIPDAILSRFNQGAVDTKELVSEVAQRNLRAVLGGQFAMKEGEQLISRAYNENLDEATNAVRVERLLLSMEKAYESKNSAILHFEKYGTLRGWKGTLPTFASIERDANLTRAEAPAGSLSADEKKELEELRKDPTLRSREPTK